MSLTDTFELSNGVKIPVVGFGTWQTPDGDVAEQSVLDALEAGYRHIDTAAIYGNESSVGRAIQKYDLPRDELFVTTKLWNDAHSYQGGKQALDDSLSRLGLDYVDLYLIHWPNPIAVRDHWQEANAEAWRAMEEGVKAGKIRAIGVSNFHEHHIESLLKTASITPQVNQIFVNPSDQQTEIIKYNQSKSILTEAYSPLGTGKIFEVPELVTLAEKYDKTVAQLVLNWHLAKGYLPLPKSVHKARIIENTEIFDFKLSTEDIDLIDGLHGAAGLAQNPDETGF